LQVPVQSRHEVNSQFFLNIMNYWYFYQTSLYRVIKEIVSTVMQHTEKNIRIIRDKLSRIGIGEKNMDDETILASYSINKFGQLCAVPKVIPPAQ
jgi:hypothetical protein